MKDYNEYFPKRYHYHYNQLKQKFKTDVEKKRGNKNKLRNGFIREVAFIRDSQIKGPIAENPDKSPVTNRFKECLINYFKCVKRDYPDDRINGFVEFEIPDQRKIHKKYLNENENQKNYLYDPNFIHNATNDEIIEMLSIYLSHDDFLMDLAESRRIILPPYTSKPENKNNGDFNKMNWLGTQKELAELFVELYRKGWIEKFDSKAIKTVFTKSKSITQVLKPIQDSKTKQNTYEQIFTTRYKPKFDTIRKNLKHK